MSTVNSDKDDKISDEMSTNESSPDEINPVESSPDEMSTNESSPDEINPVESSPDEMSTNESSPDEINPVETSPDEMSTNESSPDEINPVETSPDEKISVKKSTFNGMVIGIIVLVGVAAFFAGSYTGMNSDQITAKDLDEAIAKMELNMHQEKLPAKVEPVTVSLDDDPVIGNPDAPITIVEFSDFQCPFCARFNSQTLPLILEEYINTGKVKLVFRDFPIQSIHPNAVYAAIAAECANDQDGFKVMHDVLFDNQNQWNNLATTDAITMFSQYASAAQLDSEIFDTCLTSEYHVSEIQNDLDDGRGYGVTGTPGFFIGNDEIGYVELKGAQPYDSFKKVIEAQLGA